jgi:uridine phosphorylase
MGTDNIDIIMNELDALVNIDLNSRMVKEKPKSLNIVRLGTSGAIQPEIPLNSFIISEFGLGLDGLLNFYNIPNEVIDNQLTSEFISFIHWPKELPKPYAVGASKHLMERLGDGLIKGITATAPGFYGPQGRSLRLELANPELINKLEQFKFGNLKISNFEMETSALYGLGKLLGHNTVTVCVAIANRNKHEYNQNYKEAINQLIRLVLERITA